MVGDRTRWTMHCDRYAQAILLSWILGGCQGGAIAPDDDELRGGAPADVGDDGRHLGAAAQAPVGQGCTISAPIRIQTDGTHSVAPTLAWNGCGFGFLWAELDGSGGCTPAGWRFALLDGHGSRLGSETVLTDVGEFWEPGGLAWIGDSYVATLMIGGSYWDDGPGPGAQLFKIDATGAVIGVPHAIASEARSHSLVWTGTDFGLAWGRENTVTPWIRFQRIDVNGDPLTPEVSLSEGGWPVRLSWAPDAFALAWGSYWVPTRHQLLAADGTPIGAVTATGEPEGFLAGGPAAAATASGSMVLWPDGAPPRPLTLTVFDNTGARVSDVSVGEPSYTTHPVLTRGEGEVAAAWMGGPPFERLYFTRLDEAGTQVQPDALVTNEGVGIGCSETDAISLIPTADGYALAWTRFVNQGTDEEGYETYFARVSCSAAEALTISCPAPITMECSTASGVLASDPAIAAWRASAATTGGCEGVAVVDDAPAVFAASCESDPRPTAVTFTATDCCGNVASCTSSVSVLDRTPPVVTASLTQACLWSPNHQFVDVGEYAVADACDADASAVLSVCSDEAPAAEDGAGGAEHCPDARLGATAIELRAERSGSSGNGRVYTAVTVAAVDTCGNRASAALPSGTVAGCPGVVCVPHDQDPKSPGQTAGNAPEGPCDAVRDSPSWDSTSCEPDVACP
jgi:hypothetical protein